MGLCAAAFAAALTAAAPAQAHEAQAHGTRAHGTRAHGSGKAVVHWELKAGGTDARFRGLSAVGRNTAWVAGSKGTVLRTTDGGAPGTTSRRPARPDWSSVTSRRSTPGAPWP